MGGRDSGAIALRRGPGGLEVLQDPWLPYPVLLSGLPLSIADFF